MKLKFKKMMKDIERKYGRLIASEPFKMSKPPQLLPQRGIYLLSEGNRFLYVGRSNNIKSRLRGHQGNSHYSATFAFLLAREASGCLKASYKKDGSRQHLLAQNEFKKCFDLARKRIKKMTFRVIEEVDPTKQALLEIYTAFVTNAKYSTFDTH